MVDELSPDTWSPDTLATRLDVLKTLGDNTRYAIYLELARSPVPLATADIATTLQLHPNTVRPHLERMREVGLLELHVAATGGVGRPQHRYAVAPEAPSLGLEPPATPMLARMLVRLAAEGGLGAAEAVDAGRDQGEADADRHAPGVTCLDALNAELTRLGFDPEVVADDELVTVGFAHCPFREHAERHPELVCGLHHGMVEGFVRRRGAFRVDRFRTLVDRDGCQVDIVEVGGAPS